MLTVQYRTKDVTALAGTHYLGVEFGTLLFEQGETSGVITIKTMAVETKVIFEVELLIDGQVVNKAVGTVNP